MLLDLQNLFSYHAPQGTQTERYKIIRAAALKFAETVMNNTPGSPEQTLAIRSIQMASMQANAAIACNEDSNAAELSPIP